MLRDDEQRSNLGSDPTRFVGRDDELQRLHGWIGAGERLVSIVGPPGVGKSRLAKEAGKVLRADLAGSEHGGVWLSELSDATSRADVEESIASSLGLVLVSPGRTTGLSRLVQALAARGPLLLILDNVDRVVSATAEVLSQVVADAPRVQLVVTSRERLRLRAERVLELQPFSIPSDSAQAAAQLADLPAARLFIDRARAVQADFALDDASASDLVELLRRLDGLPLAIELAAARATVLEPGALLTRLSSWQNLLSRGARDVPARHVSLEAALSGSWSLLSPFEQRALAQLAVFSGGFDPDAVEAVLGRPEGSEPASGSWLHALQSLRDKSLVATDAGRPRRFRLLEIVRGFALARLEEMDTEAATRRRHGKVFARLAERLSREVRRQGGGAPLRQLVAERDNLRAALAHLSAHEVDEPERLQWILQMVHGLVLAAEHQGPLERCVDLIDGGLSQMVETDPPLGQLYVQLLRCRGRALRAMGRSADSVETLDKALEVALESDDWAMELGVRLDLASAVEQAGDMERAWHQVEIGLEKSRSRRQPTWEGRYLALAGRLNMYRQRFDEAAESLQAALARLEARERPLCRAKVLSNLGGVESWVGRPELARVHLNEAVALWHDLDSHEGMAGSCLLLGLMDLDEGRFDDARGYLERALDLFRRFGNQRMELHCLSSLSDLYLSQGNVESARALRLRALELSLRLGLSKDAWDVAGLGFAEWLVGELEHARDYFREAGREASGDAAPLFQAGLAGVEAELGHLEAAHAAFERAEREAGKSSLEWIRSAIRLLRLHLDLRAMAEAREADLVDEVRARCRNAERELARLHAVGPPDERHPWGPRSRMILQHPLYLLGRLVEGRLPAPSVARAHAEALDPEGSALLVEPGCVSVRPPRGDWVDLSQRLHLKAILDRLVEQRLCAPQSAVDSQTLIEAGWPHEEILDDAALTRLRTSLYRLRKLGLNGIVINTGDGYLLDTRVPVIRVEATRAAP